MSKDKIADYDGSTAGNNTDIGGISIAEGMLPSAVNNSMRELTKQLGAFSDGTDGIDVLNLHDDDASASIKIQAPSAVTTTTTLTLPDGDGDAGAMLQTNGSGQLAWSTAYRNRNLIINGAMAIDQRNGGSSVTPASGSYTLDRYQAFSSASSKYSVQQSTTAPSGFTNSLLVTSLAATTVSSGDYYMIEHKIEGLNTANLAWGTASAKAVTLSFKVYSSLTGTFGGAILNQASNRSYPFTYAVASANTWTDISITISGDTSGTWLTNNSTGLYISFSLGMGSTYSGTAGSWAGSQYWSATGATHIVGTSGATFYVTGVQLEVGEQATPFEHRSYGEELAACQRYYQQVGGSSSTIALGQCNTTTQAHFFYPLPHPMRAQATISVNDDTFFRVFNAAISGIPDVTSMTFVPLGSATNGGFRIVVNVASGLSAGNASHLYGSDSDTNFGILKIDAEL